MGKAKETLIDGVAVQETPAEVAGGLPVEAMSPNQLSLVKSATITKANVASMIQNAEALVEFFNRARTVAIKATSNQDWCVFGDKVHLCEGGVKKVLGVIGASIQNTKIDEEIRFESVDRLIKNEKGKPEVVADDRFKVGYFTATGEIDFNGKILSNVGTSSTKDDFFARRNSDGDKYYLDYDEVDKNNVKKKAVTNLSYRLCEMAFKMNPTIEELKAQGITPSGSVSFGTGSKGGSTDTADEKKLRGELRDLCLKTANDANIKPQDLLQALTAFGEDTEKPFAGYTQTDKVSVKMLSKTIAKLKNEKTVSNAVAKVMAKTGSK